MLLKIIGGLLAIWIAVAVISFVFKAVLALVVIAGILTVAAVGYSAIKGGKERRQLRR